MDLGATICTPKKPACVAVPVERRLCARARAAIRKPFRARRRSAKARCGAARPSSCCAPMAASCCARRPEKGLLGGMTRSAGQRMERTISIWTKRARARRALAQTLRWRRTAGRGQSRVHAFSAGADRVCRAGCRAARKRRKARAGRSSSRLAQEALPNVMRKVIAHALGNERGRKQWRTMQACTAWTPKPALSRSVDHRARSALRQISPAAVERRAALYRHALGRRPGLFRRRALPDLERHSRTTACCAGTRTPARSAYSASRRTTPTATPATGRAGCHLRASRPPRHPHRI